MKQILIGIIILSVILPSCKKTSSGSAYMNTATITGANLTMPVCGAKYLMVIHGVADSNAQFNSMPAASTIDLSVAVFPLYVKINWHHNTGTTCDTVSNIITIDGVAPGTSL